jgi:predicted small secreted protein
MEDRSGIRRTIAFWSVVIGAIAVVLLCLAKHAPSAFGDTTKAAFGIRLEDCYSVRVGTVIATSGTLEGVGKDVEWYADSIQPAKHESWFFDLWDPYAPNGKGVRFYTVNKTWFPKGTKLKVIGEILAPGRVLVIGTPQVVPELAIVKKR